MWVSRPLFIWVKDGMSKQSVGEQIRGIARQAAEENDLEFVHAETVGANKNLTIRVFIDKNGGVTHEDCVLVSREIETILDNGDLIPSSYLLEVSSPGLERGLYSLEDFSKFVGHPAKVKTEKAVDGQKNFRGRIAGIEGEEIIFEDKTNGAVRIPYQIILKANLEIDLEAELKKAKS